MTEYKPDVDNLKSIVEKAHFAITGDKDEQMKERLYAGVEAMVGLYQENLVLSTLRTVALSRWYAKIRIKI